MLLTLPADVIRRAAGFTLSPAFVVAARSARSDEEFCDGLRADLDRLERERFESVPSPRRHRDGSRRSWRGRSHTDSYTQVTGGPGLTIREAEARLLENDFTASLLRTQRSAGVCLLNELRWCDERNLGSVFSSVQQLLSYGASPDVHAVQNGTAKPYPDGRTALHVLGEIVTSREDLLARSSG